MKLIAVTYPDFKAGEARDICRLIDSGWYRVHIRKPGACRDDVARLLDNIPSVYYPALSLHDHFELAVEYALGGVHLNGRNPEAPAGWTGFVSRSCHSVAELDEWRSLDYLFLSPVYDSISKPEYHGRFAPDALIGVDLSNVFALGGVTPSRIGNLESVGFGGAAMLSGAWKKHISMLQFITHTDRGLEDVLRGGCRWVQLRIKDVCDAAFADVAVRALPLCRRYGATLIFDDRVELAAILGADGVHLGKKDMPVDEAREILGRSKIIGATANTVEDIKAADGVGADYIGLGPYRFTTTKKGLAPLLGIEGYSGIMAECRACGIMLPVVAIGGIEMADLRGLRSTGVDGVAVSGLILNSQDMEQITKDIIYTWKN